MLNENRFLGTFWCLSKRPTMNQRILYYNNSMLNCFLRVWQSKYGHDYIRVQRLGFVITTAYEHHLLIFNNMIG
jgi:hypothetical protein